MKKRIGRKILSLALALMMALTTMFVGGAEEVKADVASYDLVITADTETLSSSAAKSVVVGDTTTFNAKLVEYDSAGNVLNEYDTDSELWAAAAGYSISWWSTSGDASNLSLSSEAWHMSYDVTANAEGEYWFGVGVSTSGGTVKETWFGINASTVAEPTFTLSIDPVEKSVEQGGTVTLEATVLADGVETTLSDDLKLWWWSDDVEETEAFSNYDDNSGKSLTVDVALEEVGAFVVNATLEYKGAPKDVKSSTLTATAPAVGYAISINADNKEVEVENSINLTATVLKNAVAVDDIAAEDLEVIWSHDATKGNQDADYNKTTSSLTNTVTLNSVGSYYMIATLKNATTDDVLGTAKITLTATAKPADPANDVYVVELTADKTELEKGGTAKLTAKVTLNGTEITDLKAAGLQLWFWEDVWADEHKDGLELENTAYANWDENSGYSLTADVTPDKAGNYYIIAELKQGDTWLAQDDVKITVAGDTTNGAGIGTSVAAPVAAPVAATVIPLQNADFTLPITGNDLVWTGTTGSGSWTGNSFRTMAYVEDAWLETPAGFGTHCLKFDVAANDSLAVVQYVASLPAGTYTITSPVMGDDANVFLVLGDQVSHAVPLSGWNTWDTATATFTITEDMTNVKVGFLFVSTGATGGWGFVDSISMIGGVSAAPKTGDNNMIGLYIVMFAVGCTMMGVAANKRKALRK